MRSDNDIHARTVTNVDYLHVLIDAGFHSVGSIHQLVIRKSIGSSLATTKSQCVVQYN